MIEKASFNRINEVVLLAHKLWPDASINELTVEFMDLFTTNKDQVFLFVESEPIAFAHVSLRYDYVEGSKSSPTGYLEGIYVSETFRKRGIANELINECINWSKEQGCSEFASDVELHNMVSQEVHEKMGFKEVNRLVCYIKEI
jgi:aminoglycoside 6'-N-acetyltransferase I